MSSHNPRIDAYIDRAEPFAKPILRHLRKLVHEACPAVEETIKWGMPHFEYKGMLCGMSSFKAHAAFGFWKGSLILDDPSKSNDAMGQFGRITSLSELPSDATIKKYVRKAMALNEAGIKVPKTRRARPELPLPDYFLAALKKDKVLKAFDALSPSHRREYIEWISEAKSEATRERRMATAIELIGEGKSLNWKYQKK